MKTPSLATLALTFLAATPAALAQSSSDDPEPATTTEEAATGAAGFLSRVEVGVEERVWIPETFSSGSTTFSVAYDEMVEAGFTIANSTVTREGGYFLDLDRTVIGDPSKLALILRAEVDHDTAERGGERFHDTEVDANAEVFYRNADDFPGPIARQAFYVGVSIRDVNAQGAVFDLRRYEADWRPVRLVFNDRGDGIFAEVGIVRREIARGTEGLEGPNGGLPLPPTSTLVDTDLAVNGVHAGVGFEGGEVEREGAYFYIRARADWVMGFTTSTTGDAPDAVEGISSELELAAANGRGHELELHLRGDSYNTTMVNDLYEEIDRNIATFDVRLRGWVPLRRNLRATGGIEMLLVNNGLPESHPQRVRLARGSIDGGVEWRFADWATVTATTGLESRLWSNGMAPFVRAGLRIGF